jgi:hypothetical protein
MVRNRIVAIVAAATAIAIVLAAAVPGLTPPLQPQEAYAQETTVKQDFGVCSYHSTTTDSGDFNDHFNCNVQ